MVRFTTTLKRFDRQGEKTGWTYVTIPSDLAQQLMPGNKKEFKVKGRLDKYVLKRCSAIPMGDGTFIIPVNAMVRKAIHKSHGAVVDLELSPDKSPFVFNPDFMDCLADDPPAKNFFESLPGSHQRYFSKWIDSAKTDPTKVKRITLAVNALSKKLGYGEMLRAVQEKSI